MAGELGLKNTLNERVIVPMNEYRGNDGHAGRNTSLVEFIQTRATNEHGEPAGLKNSIGEPVDMTDLWCDLGIDPAQTTLSNLLTLSGDVKYLAPEMVREYILKGFNVEARHEDLCAGTESVDSLTVTTPWIQYSDEAPVATAEAETIPEAGVTWGSKTVTLAKKAISIQMTDEMLLSVRLPILAYYLQRVGIQLAATWYTEAVTCLIDGDQGDASDACAVIGVETQNTIAFEDFLKCWIKARDIGMNWVNLINNDAEALEVLSIDEFSNPQGFGSERVALQPRNRIIPPAVAHFVSSAMADDQSLLFDRSRGMVFMVFRPLLVESERIIMREIQGTKASVIAGFTTIDRAARVIIDKSLTYSGNEFPAFMASLI